MFSIPLLLTIYAGFTHAFEADHLLAVSNIVSQRSNIKLSLKDGIFWGLGHASTIFFIGVLMILFKIGISDRYFHYLESMVGFMLIGLAVYRIVKFIRDKKIVVHAHAHNHDSHTHTHLHVHVSNKQSHRHPHSLAYSVGLIHGVAGSGTVILIAIAQMKNPAEGLIYLVIFGIGCIAGMLLAAGLFSIPFSKKLLQAQGLQSFLIIISSTLCLLYGSKVIYENLIA